MEWFLDGLGTELVSRILSIILGVGVGGVIGYKIGLKKQVLRQRQKAGHTSSQKQTGEINKDNDLNEKNLSISNVKIVQEQKAKNEASQTQIGRINGNE